MRDLKFSQRLGFISWPSELWRRAVVWILRHVTVCTVVAFVFSGLREWLASRNGIPKEKCLEHKSYHITTRRHNSKKHKLSSFQNLRPHETLSLKNQNTRTPSKMTFIYLWEFVSYKFLFLRSNTRWFHGSLRRAPYRVAPGCVTYCNASHVTHRHIYIYIYICIALGDEQLCHYATAMS
jgi:hypothetical protein